MHFTRKVDLGETKFDKGIASDEARHEALVESMVDVLESVRGLNEWLRSNQKQFNFVSPRDWLDFLRKFRRILDEKKKDVFQH